MGLKVIPNDDVLMLNECIIRLAERHLLKHFSKEGRACWEVFSRDDALKCVGDPSARFTILHGLHLLIAQVP